MAGPVPPLPGSAVSWLSTAAPVEVQPLGLDAGMLADVQVRARSEAPAQSNAQGEAAPDAL
jgi:hypothetical protein